MKALLHVNYHEGERKLRELFELAYRFGYDGVELRWKYQFPDLDQSGYRNLVAALKSTYPDMEIVFGGCIDFCGSASEEQLQDDIGDYGEFLDWSHRQCGTRVMNFFTGVLKSPPTMTGFLPAIVRMRSTSSLTPSSRATLPMWSRCVLK